MKYFNIIIALLLGVPLYSQQIALQYDAKGNRTKMSITGNIPTASITGINSICGNDTTTWIASGGVTYVWSNGATANTVALTSANAGINTLTAIAANGCMHIINRELIVKPTPSGYAITGPAIVTTGTSSSFTTTARSNTLYEWQLLNTGSSILSGQNTAQLHVQWPQVPGTASLVLVQRDAGSLCAGAPAYKQVIISPPPAFTAQVYPNPLTIASVVSIANPTMDPITLTVINSLGQKIRQTVLSSATSYVQPVFDQGMPPAGVYFLQIHTGTEQKVISLVVQ